MSQSHRTPVSEVVRNSESFIHRVIDIRRRAAELSEQAARLQEEAYLAAVSELGADDGEVAYSLACRGLGVDPSLRTGATPQAPTTVPSSRPTIIQEAAPAAPAMESVVHVQPIQHRPTDPAPKIERAVAHPSNEMAVSRPVEQPRVDEAAVFSRTSAPAVSSVRETSIASPTHEDPSRLVSYGVPIKRSKIAEAEDVIDQARRTAAQNRKSNPYSDDRGRNAWRNTLFAAVLAAESSQAVAAPSPMHDEDSEIIEPSRSGEPAMVTEDDFSDVEIPLDGDVDGGEHMDTDVINPPADVLDFSSSDDVAGPAGEDVLEDIPTEPVPYRMPPPSRAVTFTNNPVQSSPQSEKPAESAPPPFARQPSAFSRGPVEKSSVPEVHVDRPVQNRTFAHGQAVPMPKGLKEAINKRADDEQPSSPITSPKPPIRKAPSFVPR